MKDEMNRLFKERFTGHESPVDPGLWDMIQGQLVAGGPPSGDEGIKELFQERFSGHEVPVDPAVWANISTQLGNGVGATAAGGAWSGALGWAAAGVGVLAIAGAAYIFGTQGAEVPPPAPKVEQPASAPSSTTEVAQQQPVAAVTEVLVANTEDRTEPRPQQVVVPNATQEAQEPTGPTHLATEDAPTLLPVGSPEEKGAEIVENIISELTTRVTEEVLAEAAQRSTLNSNPELPPPPVQETLPPSEEEDALPKLFLQNIFTPNGDGVNDTYFPVVEQGVFERIMVRVYDVRNDRLVFSSGANEHWTGDGCQDGYYLVAVEAITPDGRLISEGKVVWLNRNFQY